jgi:hypothetical protein
MHGENICYNAYPECMERTAREAEVITMEADNNASGSEQTVN